METAQESLADLLQRQRSVARIDQLNAVGINRSQISDHVWFQRWQQVCPTVIVAHSGPLTAEQCDWAAVLGCGPRAALCGRTAAARLGLVGWADDSVLHVVVERGTTPPRLPVIVKVHESRRYKPDSDVHPTQVPPITRLERSVIDAAAWTRSSRSACGLVIAAVQQRLSTPARLFTELSSVGQIRHLRLLHRVLVDIEGGAQALSEVDFAAMCRRNDLPAPTRQVIRADQDGRRRYVDVELRSKRGKSWLIEIDGAAHQLVDSYWRDMSRANNIVIGGDSMLRFPTVALYLDEKAVARQLRAALDD